jgi:hypothetical protein
VRAGELAEVRLDSSAQRIPRGQVRPWPLRESARRPCRRGAPSGDRGLPIRGARCPAPLTRAAGESGAASFRSVRRAAPQRSACMSVGSPEAVTQRGGRSLPIRSRPTSRSCA